ncbi:MAG: glycosyltransferase [Bacteriovoracaceae bacterium]|nr:glycosyltransferase [Bacteriovoracaceae bacterium]
MSNSICFFNSYQIWGGGEKWHFSTAEQALKRGHSALILANTDSEMGKKAKLELAGSVVEEISTTKSSYWNPLYILKLVSIYKKHNVDTVVFNSFVDVRNGAIAAKLAGVKRIAIRSGMPIAPAEKLWYRLSFACLTDFISISEEIANVFKIEAPRLMNNLPITYIFNGADFEFYGDMSGTPLYQRQGSEVVLGNHSRLSEQKGLTYLLQSCKKLKDRGLNFKLLIAGIGEEEENLKALQKELGLEDQVTFLGFVNNINDYMASIDITAFTSLWEGSTRTLVESMAFGKSVVCFNASTMPEMIREDENGLLVPLKDVEAFTEALAKLIEDESLRQRFEKRAVEIAHEKFDYNKNIQKFFNLLN